jgi:hypothetical protein
VNATVYDGPGWRMGGRCGGDGGILSVSTVTYIRPWWGVRIGDGWNWGGLYIWPGWWSLSYRVPSQGISAVFLVLVPVERSVICFTKLPQCKQVHTNTDVLSLFVR